MDLGHVADRPGLDDLDHAAIVVAGVDLRAHLRGHAVLLGGFGDQSRASWTVCVSGFSQ